MRKTLVDKVRKLAKSGKLQDAEELCVYGKRLDKDEALIADFYGLKDQMRDMSDNLKIQHKLKPKSQSKEGAKNFRDDFIEVGKLIADYETKISEVVICALNDRDGERLLKLANAIEFFKNRSGFALLKTFIIISGPLSSESVGQHSESRFFE